MSQSTIHSSAGVNPHKEVTKDPNRILQGQLTFIVVCCDRPRKLQRLLDSIAKFFPGVNVVVADVSENPVFVKLHEGQRVFRVGEPDEETGIANLSAGRNLALSKVGTNFFCLVDDDHFFERKKDVYSMFAACRATSKPSERPDVVGGSYHNVDGTRSHWFGHFNYEGGGIRMRIPRVRKIDTTIRVDICHNFFVARTHSIKRMGGWDPAIPIVSEHMDFFIKGKMAGLKVFHLHRANIRHDPGGDLTDEKGLKGKRRVDKAQRNYDKNRKREGFRATLLKKWSLSHLTHHRGTRHFLKTDGVLDFKKRDYRSSVGIVVLTTGRSGSSCISQVLHTLGVCMGDNLAEPQQGFSDVNPDGYFEDLRLIGLGKALANNPGAWELHNELDDHVHSLSTRYDYWGMKNPQLSLCVPALEKLRKSRGLDLRYVWIHRKLHKCVASLAKTGWLGPDSSEADGYMTQMYRKVRGHFDSLPAKIKLRVEYEDLLKDPFGETRKLAHWVGITEGNTIGRASETIKPSLRHF